jgi:hypothetical protein
VTKQWLKDMRLLKERGPVGLAKPLPLSAERIEAAIDFTFRELATPQNGTTFCWANVIQSPNALRKHYANLRLASQARRKPVVDDHIPDFE